MQSRRALCRAWVRVFFFFQAEDGIRDYKVTGVQTCALPISPVEPSTRRIPPMLSLQHFPHKVVRLGLAGCALVAAAACTDHNVAGPPGLELTRVVSFDDLKAALVEARGEANGGFNLAMWAAGGDRHG